MAKRWSRPSNARLGLLAGLAGGLLAGLAAMRRRRFLRREVRDNAAFARASEGLWPPVPPKGSAGVTIDTRRAAPERTGEPTGGTSGEGSGGSSSTRGS